MKDHPKTWIILKVITTTFVFCLLSFCWLFSSLIIPMATTHRLIAATASTAFFAGCFLWTFGKLWNFAPVRRLAIWIVLAAMAWGAGGFGWFWWRVDRFPVVTHDVAWWPYRPYSDNNKLVKAEVPEHLRFGPEDVPRLNGAYALYPIYAAVAQAMYTQEQCADWDILHTRGSDVIYQELLDGKRDLIFALAPSKKQEEEADKAGLAFEMTPFCHDAFVFYVNARNPVDNLTTGQVRAIYSGKITNWREVGAPRKAKIIPFQRNEGSGSQTTLQKLMGDVPIMPPLQEDRLGGMGDIINDTANYRNYRAALGFSFRYYATELLQNNQIRLLAIDGVAPTVATISQGTYPLVATCHMVSVRPRSENARKLVEFVLSPQGQHIVAKTGYVPLNKKLEE